MEFADFRAYRPGDELRHVDPRSLAAGQPFTREYMQRRQLMVTVVLDLTRSMTVGDGAKAVLASGLARALGFVALAGQDRLQLIVMTEEGARRSPVWQERSRASDMFGFIALSPAGAAALQVDEGSVVASTLAEMQRSADRGAVIFVISDFWDAEVVPALGALARTSGLVCALHVLSAPEREPSLLGNGSLNLVDAESGREQEVLLDADTLARYRAALGRHQDALAGALATGARGGAHLFLPIAAEEPLAEICLERLPATGVLA